MTGDPWRDDLEAGGSDDHPVAPGPFGSDPTDDDPVAPGPFGNGHAAGPVAPPEVDPAGDGADMSPDDRPLEVDLTGSAPRDEPAGGGDPGGDDLPGRAHFGEWAGGDVVGDDRPASAALGHRAGGGDPVDDDRPASVPLGHRAGGGDPVDDDPMARVADASSRIRAAARRAIEALVLVTEEPISAHLLGQLLEMSPAIVDDLCRELAAEYEDQGRGFQLVEVAGGWRYQSHPDLVPYVERYVLEGQTAKLSAAALETLAIVAYKQPISRAQVAAIRGVSVDGVMRTLQQRGYIAEIGKDPGPGQAVLFGTTRMFVEKLGLNDVRELPPLGDFVPGADVVEQLERGLRPDREPLRPEDVMGDMGPLDGDDGDDVDGDPDGARAESGFLGAGVPGDLADLDAPRAPDANGRSADGHGDGDGAGAGYGVEEE